MADKLHDGSATTYEWVIECLSDTGSGTPATPASAISLATVSVTVGQASVLDTNITDTRSPVRLVNDDPPRVRVARAATFSATSGSDNIVTFDGVVTEIGADWWSSGSGVTIPFNGYYLVTARVIFQNAGTNGGLRAIYVKPTDDFAFADQNVSGPGGSTSDWMTISCSETVTLAAGKVLNLGVKQISGSTMTIYRSDMSVTLMART